MSAHHLPISVVIPCYQSSETVERALASVLNQSALPEEIILIDDASHDGTFEKLLALQKQFCTSKIIIDVLETNSGPGEARNRAWSLASQPWLAFLDADDAWCQNKLQVQWDWIKNHPDATLVGHQTREISPDQFDTAYLKQSDTFTEGKKIYFADMLIANRFFTRTVMVRKDIPYRFQSRQYTEDYLLWLEVVLSGTPAYVLNQTLAMSFRPEFSTGGYSGQLWKHEQRELRSWFYLYQKQKISLLALLVALPWSFFKFLRRVLRRSI